MKGITVVFSLLAVASVSAPPQWPVAKVEGAIALFQVVDGSCTAFRIHPERWITAAHCVASGIAGATVGETPVEEVLVNERGEVGLAVLRTARTSGPSLTMGKAPQRGDEVLAMGYGGGAPVVIFFPGVVLTTEVMLNDVEMLSWTAPGLKGMSGGPIINPKGHVVSVIVAGFQPTDAPVLVNYGPPWAAVRALVERWSR